MAPQNNKHSDIHLQEQDLNIPPSISTYQKLTKSRKSSRIVHQKRSLSPGHREQLPPAGQTRQELAALLAKQLNIGEAKYISLNR